MKKIILITLGIASVSGVCRLYAMEGAAHLPERKKVAELKALFEKSTEKKDPVGRPVGRVKPKEREIQLPKLTGQEALELIESLKQFGPQSPSKEKALEDLDMLLRKLEKPGPVTTIPASLKFGGSFEKVRKSTPAEHHKPHQKSIQELDKLLNELEQKEITKAKKKERAQELDELLTELGESSPKVQRYSQGTLISLFLLNQLERLSQIEDIEDKLIKKKLTEEAKKVSQALQKFTEVDAKFSALFEEYVLKPKEIRKETP